MQNHLNLKTAALTTNKDITHLIKEQEAARKKTPIDLYHQIFQGATPPNVVNNAFNFKGGLPPDTQAPTTESGGGGAEGSAAYNRAKCGLFKEF